VRFRTIFPSSRNEKLSPCGQGERLVARQGRLNEVQLKELSDELATLTKQQYEARLLEVFIPMSKKEIQAFDLRTERISKIHDAKR
jgi:hypothetical protein